MAWRPGQAECSCSSTLPRQVEDLPWAHSSLGDGLLRLRSTPPKHREQSSHRLVDPLLVELVKIRTSQINGCAFCLRMHTRDALKKGESTDRLAVLPAWAETGYFSEFERAALRLAEAVADS
ncbi:carboxymuconolactone decarboxylase family protein [Nonomuraea sp. 10N515B]|uniref:carboxymuconolactone decarboxylase family protein n=1 Tax=Nonomuraea sp. 10N515B TaxID=3457422 RepID=UPI003FCE1651